MADVKKPRADFSDVQAGSSSAPMPEAGTRQETYTVQQGDSLSKIARKRYGEAAKWKIIYEANRDIIKNPDLIYPGQVLKIPQE